MQAVQLKKGDYVLRVHLRHDSASLLGQHKSLPLVLERQLGEPVTVPIYASNSDALKRGFTVKDRALHAGQPVNSVLQPLQAGLRLHVWLTRMASSLFECS